MATAVDEGTRGDDIDEAPWEKRLAKRVLQRVAESDKGEELRRRSDRIGANLFYGRHWATEMPRSRVMLTANMGKALVEHCIAIQTKQLPIPVVEAGEAGDQQSALLMRRVLQSWWVKDGMQAKLRRSLRIAKSTRTCGGKVVWDPALKGGAGDSTVDIVPGWRLILDDRAAQIENMEFIGHREIMPRSKAALFYPESADKIYAGQGTDKRNAPSGTGGIGDSPLGDAFKRTTGGNISFGTIVNGKPVISAFTNQPASSVAKDDTVQIVEMMHKDHTLYEATEKEYDPHGNPKREIVRDEAGMPLFDEQADEIMNVDGAMVAMPSFKLRFKETEKQVMKRKYPFWRRTTILLPDGVILDDIPWDGPAPYALLSDGDSLEGPWVKGGLLDCEDLQVTLNVSLSLMMDNFRLNSMRPILAGQGAQIERNNLLIGPAEVIHVGKIAEVQPFVFPDIAQSWFEWANFLISLMEKIIGASGVMQGESAGRVDSAAGYDTLAEIGGSRLVECTQRMETFIADIMRVVGWYAQKFYTDKHAIAVEDAEGNPTHERVAGPFLYGNFDYRILTGSSMAWSESAVRARLLAELQAGIIDKIAYWQRTNTPDWKQIQARILTQPPILSGASGAPPPRTRSSSHNAQKPK